MALIARILGVSLLTSALVTGLGIVLTKLLSDQAMPWTERPIAPGDRLFLAFLACVGGVIGAVAGAAREIVSAQRQKASNWADTKFEVDGPVDRLRRDKAGAR
jgi:hypothetical protein